MLYITNRNKKKRDKETKNLARKFYPVEDRSGKVSPWKKTAGRMGKKNTDDIVNQGRMDSELSE